MKIILANPVTEGQNELCVIFKPILPPEWSGLDEEERAELIEDEETAVEIELRAVQELRGGSWVDVSAEWSHRAELDDLEEEIRVRYLEYQREKYLDRMCA